MNNLAFELVTFVPWTENGIQDELVYSSMMGPDGSSIVLGRLSPLLLLGPDGTVWLARGESVVRIKDGGAPEVFALDGAGIDALTAMAPTLDAGMLLFGSQGPNNALVRLSGTGEVVWQRTDVPVQDAFSHAQLLVDIDGSTYLFARSAAKGLVIQIDLDDGEASVVVEFTETPPKNLWVREGKLFWTLYADGVRSWVSQDIETGEQALVEGEGDFQSNLSQVYAPLSGGGALLGVPSGHLIWMGQDGQETDSLTLTGIVRADPGIAVGFLEDDAIAIAQWNKGQREGVVQADLPFPSARLVYADQDGYHLLDTKGASAAGSGTCATINPEAELSIEPCPNVSELRLQHLGVVATTSAVADRDGSILLPGADPEGAYVVRITRRP